MEDEGKKGDDTPKDVDKLHPSALWVDIKGPADFLYRIWINRTFRKLVPGLVIFLVLLLLPQPEGLTVAGQRTIALFVFIVYLWVSETFPLPVTAFMAGVGLLMLGVYTGSGRTIDAFKPYAADAVFMVLGSLIMAQGLVSSGADRLIANSLIKRFAGTTFGLMAGIVLFTAMVSAVIPGHSVAAFMLPVVYSTIMASDIKDHKNEMIAFIIAIAMGCEVGSIATPSGGARNAIAIGYMDDFYGRQITYFEWVELALPLTLILIPVTIALLMLVFRVKNRRIEVKPPKVTEQQGFRPYLGLAILLTTVVMFLTISDILSLGAVAMLGGILMFVFGLLRWESARGELRWGVIFIYGAALTVGEALRATGAADWMANGALGGLEGIGIIGLVTIVVVLTALFTNVMSDAAATALMLPIVMPMAFLAGVDAGDKGLEYAFLISIATAIASGFAYLTVFGTPPNTIVHASGLVTTKDFLKGGLPIWIASVLIMLLLVNTYWRLIV
jgi:sodium-dependent dicarboxylate transporter 2/3/5